eukprot:4175501-Prymnesium_polylepis.1
MRLAASNATRRLQCEPRLGCLLAPPCTSLHLAPPCTLHLLAPPCTSLHLLAPPCTLAAERQPRGWGREAARASTKAGGGRRRALRPPVLSADRPGVGGG